MPPSPSSTGVKGEPPRSLGRCHCRSTERLSAWHVGFQGASLAAHQSEIKVEDDERGQEECWLHEASLERRTGVRNSQERARPSGSPPPLRSRPAQPPLSQTTYTHPTPPSLRVFSRSIRCTRTVAPPPDLPGQHRVHIKLAPVCRLPTYNMRTWGANRTRRENAAQSTSAASGPNDGHYHRQESLPIGSGRLP
jgi:hypothetical protein